MDQMCLNWIRKELFEEFVGVSGVFGFDSGYELD